MKTLKKLRPGKIKLIIQTPTLPSAGLDLGSMSLPDCFKVINILKDLMFLSGYTNMKYHLDKNSHTQDILLISYLKKMSHFEQESRLAATYWTSLAILQRILHPWRQSSAIDSLFS